MSHANENEKDRVGKYKNKIKRKVLNFVFFFSIVWGPAGLLLFFALLKSLANWGLKV